MSLYAGLSAAAQTEQESPTRLEPVVVTGGDEHAVVRADRAGHHRAIGDIQPRVVEDLAVGADHPFALVLAACATLAVNPRACGDVGWQLSFAAVIAPASVEFTSPTTIRVALFGLKFVV